MTLALLTLACCYLVAIAALWLRAWLTHNTNRDNQQ